MHLGMLRPDEGWTGSPSKVAAPSRASRSSTPRSPTHTPRRPGTAELCRRADQLVKEVTLVEDRCNKQLEELATEVHSPKQTSPRSRQETPRSRQESPRSRQESRQSTRSQRAATAEAVARKAASDEKWARIHANWLAGQQPAKTTVTLELGYSYATVAAEKKPAAEARAAARAVAERKAKERAAALRQSLARADAERALVAKALAAKTAAEERHDGRWPPGRDPFEVPRKVWVG